MKFKISFKKEKRQRGLSAVGNPFPDTRIKLDKKVIGFITAPNYLVHDGLWRVRFMVANEENWRWATMKAKFDSEPEARKWIKENFKRVNDSYTLILKDDSDYD